MHLLYVDESGSVQNQSEEYFVVAGLAAFERQTYWINKNTEALLQSRVPGAPAELHASQIANHNTPPWNGLTVAQRNEVLGATYDLIASARCVLFGVAVHKHSFPTQDPLALAFQELCLRFDRYLGRLHESGDTQRGIMIFDETRHESRLQTLLQHFRATGTTKGKVFNFAEVPLFADSRSTRLLQLADFCAYAVFRRFERGYTPYLDKLLPRFDQTDGRLHGLVHLITDYHDCYCPACMSRRAPTSLDVAPVAAASEKEDATRSVLPV